MAIEVKKLRVNEGNIKILLYGSSGSGKTMSAKYLGKVLLISAESGELSLAGADNIDIIKITNFEQIKEAYMYIQEHRQEYDFVVIDSLTEIGEQIVAYLKTLPEYSDQRDSYKLWMVYTELLIKIVKSFRDLEDIGVLVIALDESVKNGLDEKIMPNIPAKKAQTKLPALFDEVLYLRVREDGVREFVCHPTSDIIAKDRSGKLPQIVECSLNEGIGKIIKIIKGE